MRLKKIIASLLGIGLLAAPVAVIGGSQATAAPTSPAIWLVPHQDDDILSHGVDMKIHVNAGRRVMAVLLTDGSSSGVCDQDKDGTIEPTERAGCTAQRDAEFKASMNQIGVEPIIAPGRAQDGSLSRAFVESVIAEYQALYPDASFKGYTYKESLHCTGCGNGTSGAGHPDHDAVGEALRARYNAGATTDVRYYVKASMWKHWPGVNNERPIGYFTDRLNLNTALDMYGPLAPDAPDSTFEPGIGQRSSSLFCEQYAGTRAQPCASYSYFNSGGADNYVHLPGK